MQLSPLESSERCVPHFVASPDFASASDGEIAKSAAVDDALLLESLMLNLDASLQRAHASAFLQLDAGPAAKSDPARAADLRAARWRAAFVPRRQLLDDCV